MNNRHVESAARLRDQLANKIPLASAMQLSVESWDGRQLEIAAPLAPNRNDKQTAFGGSLYSLAVLSCWGLFTMRLWEEGLECEVVIQEASASYLLPVANDMVSRCVLADDELWRSTMTQLRRRGRARIALDAEIFAGAEPAFRLRGRFIAFLPGIPEKRSVR